MTSFELLALRYATTSSPRSEQFHRYSVYQEPDGPMEMDYFFWALRRASGVTLIDTGFHPDALATRPGRDCLIAPLDALRSIGVDPDQVERVIVSHFHYDHIGNLSAFPDAELVVQKAELDFWLGPHAGYPIVSSSVEARELEYIREAHESGRITVVDGDVELEEGIALERVGGHCPGQQIVRLDGPKVVLASDALHFNEEMERNMPFKVFFDLDEVFGTYDRLNQLQGHGYSVVAGHDPSVMRKFPALPGNADLCVQLGVGG